MTYTFMMSRSDYSISKLLKKLGYSEAADGKIPDFMVFGGGSDVTPYLYNQQPKVGTFASQDNDYQDFCTVIASKLKQIPMLGICRGLQLLHVANGGTLIQHIDNHAGTIHRMLTRGGKKIPGWEDLSVNSTHHQSVPVEETHYAEEVYTGGDSVTEGVVALKKGFVGVQYHPEFANCPEEGVEFFTELLKHKLEGIL
jgi:putative glutamine amidotransferase